MRGGPAPENLFKLSIQSLCSVEARRIETSIRHHLHPQIIYNTIDRQLALAYIDQIYRGTRNLPLHLQEIKNIQNINSNSIWGGGKIGHSTQNLVKSARVCTMITLL